MREDCHISQMTVIFFFKQKTAYEMRISDWSSDVCSSDLAISRNGPSGRVTCRPRRPLSSSTSSRLPPPRSPISPSASGMPATTPPAEDRKSVVEGKSVSVRVDLGGRRIIKKKTIAIPLRQQHKNLIHTVYNTIPNN